MESKKSGQKTNRFPTEQLNLFVRIILGLLSVKHGNIFLKF